MRWSKKLEADNRASRRSGGLCRTYAVSATDSRLKAATSGSLLDTGRSNASGRVRPAAASTIGRPRKTARTAEKQKCDNLINALTLVANQQKNGDSPVKMVVQGLHDRSRLKMMDGRRSFIMVDKHGVGESW